MSTHRRPTLPNFLVIGAMKAGTTSLYQYLRHHPQVFMSSRKELHFFTARGGTDIAWYERQFAEADGAIAIGEASASYTTYPDSEGVPERIAGLIPDARLIYLVRDPIERMRSHYLQRLSGGDESAPVEHALFSNPVYLNTSRYADQIERYMRRFPPEQILIVKSEDLRDHRLATLSRIYGFIGVDGSLTPDAAEREYYETSEKRALRAPLQALRRMPLARSLVRLAPTSVSRLGRRVASRPVNVGRSEISQDVRIRLADLLREDVLRLQNLAGMDLSGWGIA